MLSLRNQVLRQEGVNSVPYQGVGRESIDYVSSPLTKGARGEYSATTTPSYKGRARRGNILWPIPSYNYDREKKSINFIMFSITKGGKRENIDYIGFFS